MEHLVAPIAADPHAVTVPLIDGIDDTTLKFIFTNDLKRGINMGGFLWDLTFYWFGLPRDVQENRGPADNAKLVVFS